jgi:hypothetical protein
MILFMIIVYKKIDSLNEVRKGIWNIEFRLSPKLMLKFVFVIAIKIIATEGTECTQIFSVLSCAFCGKRIRLGDQKYQ